ncbi:MAG: potassium channel family protein [Planctomycetaceae bacterium]
MQKVAVIGLGRFGTALARTLATSGVQVIAIDRNGQLVSELADDVDVAVRLDATDKQALISQDIDQVDVGVVSIGENFEAALLTTVLLRQLNVPQVICRAQTQFHAEIFRQIGAHQVIQPEHEAGLDLARRIANPQLLDAFHVADGYSLIELRAPEAFIGKSLRHLALRQAYDVNLLIIRRPKPIPEDSPPEASPAPVYELRVPKADELVQRDDILVLVGSDKALSCLPRE